MKGLRKYIVEYYGWIASYGDWDCDDFIVRAPNMKEAKVIMNERLKGKLIKGNPYICLYSTAKRKMEEWDKKEEERRSKINACNKTRNVDEPYEVWKSHNGSWEWRVLKKYQTPRLEKQNKHARWYCAVKSPYTYGGWEYGDTYVKDVKQYAEQIK